VANPALTLDEPCILRGVSFFPNGVRIFQNSVRIFSNGVSIFPNGVRIFQRAVHIWISAYLVQGLHQTVHQATSCIPADWKLLVQGCRVFAE
jgi:hypothetical protein